MIAKMIRLGGAALVLTGAAVSVAACGTSGTAESSENVGSAEGHLANVTSVGNSFFGSDTLFDAMQLALSDWAADPNTTLSGNFHYLGTGSGNGENCMRGNGVTYGGSTYCRSGDPGTSPGQTIAPMSRDVNTGCSVTIGAQTATLKTRRVALDGIGAWVKSGTATTNISKTDLRNLFCGTDGHGTAGCTTTFGGSAVSLYRRDNLSGTTDTFRSLVGCSSTVTEWCPGIHVVADGAGAPTLDGGAATDCAAGDSATDCIGKIVQAGTGRLGYAGLEAGAASGAMSLTVDSVPADVTHIRYLVTPVDGGTPYPLARFLYLNELTGTAAPRAAAETQFLAWVNETGIYAGSGSKAQFESDLVAKGFIACDPGSALNCGTSTAVFPIHCP